MPGPGGPGGPKTERTAYPKWVAADAFLGPCVSFDGIDANMECFTGTISAPNAPTQAHLGTWVAVVRLNAAGLAAQPRQFRMSAGGFQIGLGLSDSATSAAWYYYTYVGSTYIGGVSNATAPADTLPHVVVGGPSASSIKMSTDHVGSEWLVNVSAQAGNTPPGAYGLPAATALAVDIPYNISGGGVSLGKFFLAFLAYIPYGCTEAEHRQIVDCARNEWVMNA